MKELHKKQIYPICPMCHIQFDSYYHNPRIVPKCGHTFCQKCITNSTLTKSNRKTFTCSQCNLQSTIRKNVKQQFTKNLTILEVIKDLKKAKAQFKVPEMMCLQHNKPLQFKCQTCRQLLICSHCALIGSHKTHTFVQAEKAGSQDLQQLKKIFQILTSSMQKTMFPESVTNIVKRLKNETIDGLHKTIKNHFRQYYEPIERKQQQILNECTDMEINGSIYKGIDRILNEYDHLKFQYQNCIHGTSNVEIDELIKKVQAMHQQIQIVIKSSEDQVIKHIHQLGKKIHNTNIFKVQEIPFSLKNLIEGRQARQSKSPSHTKHRSTFTSHEKVIQKYQTKQNANKIKRQGVYVHYEQKKEENETKSVNIIKNQEKQFEPYPKSQRPPKDKKSTTNIVSKTIHPLLNEKTYQNKRQSLDKSQISSKKIQSASRNKLKEQLISMNDFKEQKLQLKYTRPLKQISYDLRPKFQQITKQIDRQEGLTSLELIGMQINDVLLSYILDYIRTKKMKFSMIKLVKNSITDEGFKMILSFLQKDNYAKVLNMTANQLTAKIISLIIHSAEENKILKTIYLSNNKITAFNIKARKAQLDLSDIQIIL